MDELRNDWKQGMLEDFSRWLAALPEEPSEEPEVAPPQTDLRDLFAEFAALRQEIRLQNREQAKTVRTLENMAVAQQSAAEAAANAKYDIASRQEEFGKFERRIERHCLLPFLDVRDALVRGRDSATRLSEKRGLFRRSPIGIEGVVEGYELAIQRLDRALAQLGVEVVAALDLPFDARTMNAVATDQRPHTDDGIVLEEFLSGFVRGDEVLRPAEVVVNRRLGPKE